MSKRSEETALDYQLKLREMKLNGRKQEIWFVRNKIEDLLKEHKCHIELGVDVIAGKAFYVCADEEHDIKTDAPISMFK